MNEELFTILFSRRLTYYLEKNKMSKLKLANILNVSPSSVSAWTNGITIPRMDKVDAMCEVFGCTRDELITDINSNEKQEEEYIEKFNQLTCKEKELVLQLIDTMLEGRL